jgi:ABC-type transporter Mla subunit MlaD
MPSAQLQEWTVTSSTRTQNNRPDVLEDIQEVLADVLSEFTRNPDQTVQSMAKTLAKDVAKGAALGALQGFVDAVISLLRNAGEAVLEYLDSIVQRLKQLLLQAIEEITRYARRLQDPSGEKVVTGEVDEDDDHDSLDDREPAGPERLASS